MEEKQEPAPAGAAWKSFEVFKAAATFISISGIYLYFSGWVFAYFFYRNFGVSLVAIDTPLQYFLTYSYSVLSAWPGLLFLGSWLVVVVAAAVGRLAQPVLLLCLALSFPALFLAARKTADNDANFDRDHPETVVHFQFKDPEKAADRPPLQDVNQAQTSRLTVLERSSSLHLLLETKDRLILFYQPAPIVSGARAQVFVFSVMRSDLAWSFVLAQ